MKDHDKNKSSYIKYLDVNNLYGSAQKLPVNDFKWIKDNSQFNEDFIKTVMKKMMKGIFLKFMCNLLKNYINVIIIYHFYQKELKLKKSKNL